MPRMGPKDYRAIGTALRAAEFDSNGIDDAMASLVIRNVALRIADVFQDDNPRFDRERFLRFVKTGLDARRATERKR